MTGRDSVASECLRTLDWVKGFAIGAHQFEISDPTAERIVNSTLALPI
ncbi:MULTISPECIES: hypothetical protein [unclassified Rhizobium]|nr:MULTISPECIES: hypothetical protein [unclassified Rhizobium]QYA13651.1 hypothetical protein J5284_05360 [Rhizobium sp. AB2/73]UEQ80419.1 hypothetical protein I8E17_16640 [Rhizobium sp. AB2/73]